MSPFILSATTDPPRIADLGGKGAGLLYLKQQGFPVPDFVVLPVGFSGRDLREQATIVETIRQHFGPEELLAVRSSAVIEDGPTHSFAGQFSTLLGVSAGALPAAVATVLQSAGNRQARAYRQQAGLAAAPVPMAVVIQKMVPATCSGVAFSIDPLTQDDRTIVINAVRGLGEQLVGGTINADRYTVQPHGTIHTTSIAAEPVLNERQIRMVAATLGQVAGLYGKPMDMEFAFSGDQLYVLQARPVTTAAQRQERIIWDNSNIVESYPGLTLPLTFSFIEKMYEAVYRQFSLVLGVSPRKVRAAAPVFAQMLGLLNGRVYYNLNSWFRALALLPGYSLNASFMEQMMGVKEKPVFDFRPDDGPKGFRAYAAIAGAGWGLLQHLGTARRQKAAFVQGFDAVYREYRNKDFARQPWQQTLADYRQFEALMVQRWKAPLVNDLFAMIYFGLLRGFCGKLFPEDERLHNELLMGSGDIVTTEPARRLPALAAAVQRRETLAAVFRQEDAESAWTTLQQEAFREECDLFRAYLEDWGDRSLAELKLETVTYRQNPAALVAVVQAYLRDGLLSYAPAEDTALARLAAERKVARALKGKPLKKAWFRHLLRQARYFVSNRENLRYYRTKGFGMVRRMMLGIGCQLQQCEALDRPEDIFYLRLQDLEQGDKAFFREKVHTAREQYRQYARLPLPQRVETYGLPDSFLVREMEQQPSGALQQLKGIPCSAGAVRAQVRVLHDASGLHSLEGCILAAYATDPGWVVLFPSASGILTERGSLLSHAAIVSREMGIPCIVGIDGLMEQLQDGTEIIMDGSSGLITLIHPPT